MAFIGTLFIFCCIVLILLMLADIISIKIKLNKQDGCCHEFTAWCIPKRSKGFFLSFTYRQRKCKICGMEQREEA